MSTGGLGADAKQPGWYVAQLPDVEAPLRKPKQRTPLFWMAGDRGGRWRRWLWEWKTVDENLWPKRESLRMAVRWLDEQRRDNPSVKMARLIGEASTRFNLSPLEEQFLLDHLGKTEEAAQAHEVPD